MPNTIIPTRNSSRSGKPFNPGRRHRTNFARAAVFAEFGHHGWALDQGDFEDRRPWRMPVPSPEARLK